jgi:transcription elongation GreA/GreB family factor
MSFRPDEAVRLLEPLEPGHFLLDKLERLHDLRKLTSGDLLIRLFTSIKRHCSLSEIKELLSGIVPAAEWNAWWTAAKKDRRLTVSMDNVCSWNDSADDADAVIMRQFDAADPRSRMALLKIHANRSPQQAAQMIAGLVTDAHASAEPDPGLSLELFLSAGTNQSDTNGGALRALLCRSNIEEIVRGIEDRYLRKKAIVLIREVNDAWPGIYCHLLKTEGDMQTLTLLYDALSDAANCRLGDLVRETLSLPALAPDFFIWLCRELFSRPELVQFADWQFIQLVVRLLSDTAMKKQNGALRKLFDTDSTVHVLARKLDPGQARQFIALLERDSQLEEYRRVAMLKDLYAWYPATQVIEDRTFFVTPRILQARQEEFLKITAVDIPENTEEIMKARAHGDLKENFEYHAARARQEMLSSRAKTLHDQLQLARPIDPAKIDTAAITIGTKAVLSPVNQGSEAVVSILGPWDSDPDSSVLSYLAPMAAGLLGKHVGDTICYHEQEFVVKSISKWE